MRIVLTIALLLVAAGFTWASLVAFDVQLFGILISPFLLVIGAALLSLNRNGSPIAAIRSIGQVVATIAWTASVIIWQWPLRLGFEMSRADLNRLMARAGHRESLTFPATAGIYRVVAYEERGSSAMLILQFNPGGHTGFVRNTLDGEPGFNPWTEVKLADGWWLVSED